MRRFRAKTCPACGLRFPADDGSDAGAACPACHAPTQPDPRAYTTARASPDPAPTGPPVVALLDNIRSLTNVGTIFRTADGAGVRHLHLAGVTPTPEHPRLEKTALGSQDRVPWTHHKSAPDAAAVLAGEGTELWALEGGGQEAVFQAPLPAGPVCLVLGHEVSGIDPRVHARCTRTVHLPMSGIKSSLNVAVAFSIAVYIVRHRLRPVDR